MASVAAQYSVGNAWLYLLSGARIPNHVRQDLWGSPQMSCCHSAAHILWHVSTRQAVKHPAPTLSSAALLPIEDCGADDNEATVAAPARLRSLSPARSHMSRYGGASVLAFSRALHDYISLVHHQAAISACLVNTLCSTSGTHHRRLW